MTRNLNDLIDDRGAMIPIMEADRLAFMEQEVGDGPGPSEVPTFKVDLKAAQAAGYASPKHAERAAKRAFRYMKNQGGLPPGHIREKYALVQVIGGVQPGRVISTKASLGALPRHSNGGGGGGS